MSLDLLQYLFLSTINPDLNCHYLLDLFSSLQSESFLFWFRSISIFYMICCFLTSALLHRQCAFLISSPPCYHVFLFDLLPKPSTFCLLGLLSSLTSETLDLGSNSTTSCFIDLLSSLLWSLGPGCWTNHLTSKQ